MKSDWNYAPKGQLSNAEYLGNILKIPAPVGMETLCLGDFVRIIGGGCGYIEEFHQITAGAWIAFVSFNYDGSIEGHWVDCCDLRKVNV